MPYLDGGDDAAHAGALELDAGLVRLRLVRVGGVRVRLVRASPLRVERGHIDRLRGGVGFVRPSVAGRSKSGEGLTSEGSIRDTNVGMVDEGYKPGRGGRDGTIFFAMRDCVPPPPQLTVHDE